ncbi:hypothetical protein C8J57DRAFT_1634617 [Mycena rebaudengoi]|nr:hypothetical protein C8J57DRAFT_1634617 [Mycena rebaudengoi]
MNANYDLEAAKAGIQLWAEYMATHQEHLKNAGNIGPAHQMQIAHIAAKRAGFPVCHKAVYKSEGSSGQEIELTVVGLLVDKELPPVKKNKLTRNNLLFARQQVSLVGLNTVAFDEAIKRLMLVAYEIEREFDSGDIVPFAPSPAKDEQYGMPIDAACRYYTLAREAPAEQIVDFNPKTDTSRALTAMLGQGVFHCVDNDVAYMDLVNDRLVYKDPAGFRPGDIVELGVSVVAFKGHRDAKSVVKLVMRSLVYLDGTHTRNAMMAERMAACSKLTTAHRTVQAQTDVHKRSVMYVDEDSEDEVSGRLSRASPMRAGGRRPTARKYARRRPPCVQRRPLLEPPHNNRGLPALPHEAPPLEPSLSRACAPPRDDLACDRTPHMSASAMISNAMAVRRAYDEIDKGLYEAMRVEGKEKKKRQHTDSSSEAALPCRRSRPG